MSVNVRTNHNNNICVLYNGKELYINQIALE